MVEAVKTPTTVTRGGEFLIKETPAHAVFIPEEWTEEQLAVAQTVRDFLQAYVHPNLEKIDSQSDPKFVPSLLDKAGELGILGLAIPETYGGFEQNLNTNMLATEELGIGHAFSVSISAHTGIGTLPILYFGTEEQKQKYLPKLATGELKAAYCLTEPGSGSDALGARTKAVLSPDGKNYILNGQKMWITNAGFADVFVVFAKIDGEKFTGFIVERNTPGMSFGEEEKKMGIKGSSTRQVFFMDSPVPVENVLGEIGRGHLIAFNILNIGRLKLGAATVGASKAVTTQTIRYANERKQFQRSISSFGAIQHKIAEQAIRSFVLESAVYRASNDIQEKEAALIAEGKPHSEALLGAAQEYAAECAILKVLGSETLDFIVDEGVQTFGGYGFSAEYPMDRAYRDSRINRIFEGTNEINRMLTVEYVLKKAMKGELNLFAAVMAVQQEISSAPESNGNGSEAFLTKEKTLLHNFKKATLLTTGAAAQKYMQKLAGEQQILLHLADMIIYVYAAESALLRIEKLAAGRGAQAVALHIDALNVYLFDAAYKIYYAAKNVIYAISEGDEQNRLIAGLKQWMVTGPINTIAARKRIAETMIANGEYKL